MEIAAGTEGFAYAEPRRNMESALLDDRMSTRRAKFDEFTSQINALRVSAHSSNVTVKVDVATLKLESERYRVLHKLYDEGYYPKLQLVQAFEQLLQAKSTLAHDASNEVAVNDQVDQISAQARGFASQQHAEAISQYIQSLRDLQSTVAEIKREQHLLSLSDVRSPFDASVLDVAQLNGTTIGSAQPVVTIIPFTAPLQAEVYVDNKDVSYLQRGMKARVKIDAYRFEKYGWLTGHLSAVIRDTTIQPMEDRPSGSGDTNDAPRIGRYRAIIVLDSTRLRDVSHATFLPGMTVEADLKVGTQTLISYLFDPLVHHYGNTFSEPP